MFSRNKLILESVDTDILLETPIQKSINDNYAASLETINNIKQCEFVTDSNNIIASKVKDYFYFADIKKIGKNVNLKPIKVHTLEYDKDDFESCTITVYRLSMNLVDFSVRKFNVNVFYLKDSRNDSAIDSISESFYCDGLFVFAKDPYARNMNPGNPLCAKSLLQSELEKAYKQNHIKKDITTQNKQKVTASSVKDKKQKNKRAKNTITFDINNEKFLQEFKKKSKTQPLTKKEIDDFVEDSDLKEEKLSIKSKDKWKTDYLGPSNVIGDESAYTIDELVKKSHDSIESFKKSTEILSNKFEGTYLQEIIEDTEKGLLKYDAPSIKGFAYDKKEFQSMVGDINSKPMELVQPIALSKLDSMCSFNGSNASKNNFVIAMCNGNEDNIKNILVRFPISGTEMLYDSIEYIPQNDGNTYRPLYISSKAGYAGKGASASIVSLAMGLLNLDTPRISEIRKRLYANHKKELKGKNQAEQYVNDILSEASEQKSSLYNAIMTNESLAVFKNEAITLAAFTLSKPQFHPLVARVLIDKYHTIEGYTYQQISTEAMSRLILYILNSMKYDFAQIDTKVDYNYDAEGDSTVFLKHTIQYPAVFEGSCKVEVKAAGVFFHITGK